MQASSGAGQPNLPSTYGPQLSRAVEALEDHPRVVGQATHHGGIELQPLAHTCTHRESELCMYVCMHISIIWIVCSEDICCPVFTNKIVLNGNTFESMLT